jgi:vacuolar-type H+-ATPase subunit E/Vma4
LLRSAEKRIKEALMVIRQDVERFAGAMRALLDEALREIDGTAVRSWEEATDGFCLRALGYRRARGRHTFGGCTVTDAEGERIVDNKFEGDGRRSKKRSFRRISAALWPLWRR